MFRAHDDTPRVFHVRHEGPMNMRSRPHLCGIASMALLTLVLCSGCDRKPAPSAPAIAEPPDATKLLSQMFDSLSQARQLTFKATRHLDAALLSGALAAETAEVEMWVSRPQMARARATSDAGVRTVYVDGQHVSLMDDTMKVYATVPLTGTLDEVVDALDDRYGFTPPLAEFVLNDPRRKLGPQIQNTAYKGKETLSGVDCDHLALTGEVADAELWIGTADHLPRKLVATFKDRDGSPQLQIDFKEWNTAARLEPSAFAFDPPKDAEQIAMVTVDENAAPSKGGKR
jgi:hypothetical protein